MNEIRICIVFIKPHDDENISSTRCFDNIDIQMPDEMQNV